MGAENLYGTGDVLDNGFFVFEVCEIKILDTAGSTDSEDITLNITIKQRGIFLLCNTIDYFFKLGIGGNNVHKE